MPKVIINGSSVDFNAAVILMDDELREELHRELVGCTEQEFADAYAAAHEQKFSEIFVVN